MTPRVRKNAEERKSEIIETTLVLADKVGPDRLSTDRIAKALGLTQAAIFRHFPKKQDLWEAVALRIGEKYQRGWLSSERRTPDPVHQLRDLLSNQLKLIEATPAIPAILFSRELHVESRVLRKIFGELMRQFHKRIQSLLRRAQDEGLIRTEVAPADAAFLIIGIAQGLVLRWSVSGRTFGLAEEGGRLLDIQLALLRNHAGADRDPGT